MQLSEDKIKRKVLTDISQQGIHLVDTEKLQKYYDDLVNRKKSIERELDPNNEEGNVGSTIKKGETILSKSKTCINKTKNVLDHIKNDLEEVDEVRRHISEKFDKLNTLQTTLQYLKVIQQIEYLNAELQKDGDDEWRVTLFANLTELNRILANSQAEHLMNHLNDTIYHWHGVLKEKFAKDFDEALKLIKWPFISANFSLVTPLPSHIEKLQVITEYLVEIELPKENHTTVLAPGLLSDFPPLPLPIHYLVQPLRKRFLYHFYGAKQTNRADKPEWYFTQILTWMRDHNYFLAKYIQPVLDKFGLHHIDAQLEFMKGLVKLAVEKLNHELPNMQYDDFTFSHTVDEALGFDKELRETYLYPPDQPSVMNVLTQAKIFVKWLAMEKKFALEKMDAMLPPNSVDAFEPLTSDVHDLKITTCADAFITLLQTITERCESLRQPGHKLQFLELQLELLDDFRVRLLQIVNAEEGDVIDSKIPMVANSLYYIENVLVDWGTMLHFINLYYYKNQLDNEKPSRLSHNDLEDNSHLNDIESDTVFCETLSLYRHMRRDLLSILSETVMHEIKAKSRNYRRERWSSMKVEKEFRCMSLTPSSCPMFEVLARRLHQLMKGLQSKLFNIVWKNIAVQLDTYLFEDIIMDNKFNAGGALQLKYDVHRNLLPLFLQFSEKPQNYFTQTIEAINLLNIAKGSALLLRETLIALEGATGVEDTRGKALKEIGVNNFSPKMAVKILNQRTDITVNRMVID